MQDRVFQPVSGPLYEAENNMKTAPQLRLGNEWEGRTQTRSKRNNSCRFQRNRCGFLPLITVWLQVRVLPGCRAGAHRAKAGCAARELRLGKPCCDHQRERQPQGPTRLSLPTKISKTTPCKVARRSLAWMP